MLVQNLIIEEFRGIKRCNSPINLSPLTVLIGRNNSGKSTILEALSLLPSPNIFDYFTEDEKIGSLLSLHRSYRKESKDYRPLLYLYSGTSKIKYLIEGQIVEIQIDEISSRAMIKGEKIVNNKQICEFFHVNFDRSEQLRNLVLHIPNDSSITVKMEERMESLKELIVKYGYHVDVAKRLNESIDDEYSEIVFLRPISIRKVFPHNFTYIELRDLGSGAEKAIKIMSLIEAINPKLLLIDDFETGFHPSLIKVVLNWLKDRKWQTVISTHSIDVLYELVEINPIDTTILQLHKSNEDILSYKILTLEKLKNYLNSNTDPRLLVDALHL
jgi:predicted ATP-dependent endonuclease of OLD family